MEILEFGDKNKRKLVLIHGFQSPYQIWNPYIEHYKKDFYIIVPILPGHNPNQKDDFVSFARYSLIRLSDAGTSVSLIGVRRDIFVICCSKRSGS